LWFSLFQSISSSIKVSEVRNECKKIPPIPKLENGTPFICFSRYGFLYEKKNAGVVIDVDLLW